MSNMVLPQIARLLCWVRPTTLTEYNFDAANADSVSVETLVIKYAALHCRHVSEEMLCGGTDHPSGKEQFGVSHEGIADSEAAQFASVVVRKAASNSKEKCQGMVNEVYGLIADGLLRDLCKVARDTLCGKGRVMHCNIVETIILLRAILNSSSIDYGAVDDIEVCAHQICALHAGVNGADYQCLIEPIYDELPPSLAACRSLPAEVSLHPNKISENSVLSSPSEQGNGDLRDVAREALRRLISKIFKCSRSYCKCLKGKHSLWWIRFLLCWICAEKQKSQWYGTTSSTEDVLVELFGIMAGLILRSGAGEGEAEAEKQQIQQVSSLCISQLGKKLTLGAFKCGGVSIRIRVLRSMLQLASDAACIGGGTVEKKFYASLGGVLLSANAPLEARADQGGSSLFDGIRIDTMQDDVVKKLPTTPDKTPKADSGATMEDNKNPQLATAPAVTDVAEDWDDWDDDSSEEEDAGTDGHECTKDGASQTPQSCVLFFLRSLRESGHPSLSEVSSSSLEAESATKENAASSEGNVSDDMRCIFATIRLV